MKKKDVFGKYLIPNTYLVGFGRTLAFQSKCLRCEKLFFYEAHKAFCSYCRIIGKRWQYIKGENISDKPKFGNLKGIIQKTQASFKKRSFNNYCKVLKRDDYICQYCDYDFNFNDLLKQISIDHIIPYSHGGSNDIDNMVVACLECNRLASNMVFDSFLDKKKYILEQRHKRKMT